MKTRIIAAVVFGLVVLGATAVPVSAAVVVKPAPAPGLQFPPGIRFP